MASNSIIIKRFGAKIQEEITATAVAIKPGYLLEMASATTGRTHSTAAGNVFPMFAVENELEGKAITADYAVSSKIQVWIPRRGDIVYAYLADGQNASAGNFLESASGGTLQVHVDDPDTWTSASPSGPATIPASIVGVAMEAVDLSGSANLTAIGRIKVRIL